jgi:hypothetical protein
VTSWLHFRSIRDATAVLRGVVSVEAMAQESSSDSSGTMVASGISTGLATLCVALRFYTRIRTKAGVAWDDWWILVGLLTMLLTGGLLLWGTFPTLLKPYSPANDFKAATQIQTLRMQLRRRYSITRPTPSTLHLIHSTSSSRSYPRSSILPLSRLSRYRSCLCTVAYSPLIAPSVSSLSSSSASSPPSGWPSP